ncbi:MAG: hypothetical protein RIG62_14455 [Cyclobacteriaceae bacterium]
MKHVTVLAIALLCISVYNPLTAQTIRSIYTNPNFDQIASDHRTVAIIPFKAVIKLRPKDMADMAAEDLARMEQQEGESVQSALYGYFLKRQGKDDYRVAFQDISKTNALLAKNGITHDVLSEYTMSELAGMLGVDAVISGRLESNKPISEGAAVALSLLVGVYGPTNSGKVSIFINDGTDDELLWKYEKALSRSLGSDTNTIVNALMRKASRQFPYAQ